MALLEFREKYIVQSSNSVSTTNPSLVDDTEAIKTFTITADMPLTALVIYSEHNLVAVDNNSRWGNLAAINVDGTDYSQVGDSGDVSAGYSRSIRNTTFWVGTLNPGSHTIKGRFASVENSVTSVIDNRTLIIYLFYGDEFTFLSSGTAQVLSTNSLVDDASASITKTPSGACKGLFLYVASNIGIMPSEAPVGKKVAINVGGTDYNQAEKSPLDSSWNDSVFTAHAAALSAVAVTAKGRAACNRSGYTCTISRRQLAVLFLANNTLMDVVSNTMQTSTTSASLVDDPNASIARTTTDSCELLVIGMATKRDGTTGTTYGERYGIKVDVNDRAQSRGSPYSTTTADSVSIAWGETMAAGAHTVKGRISTNSGTNTAIVNARFMVALWLFPTKTRRIIGIGSGAFHLTGKSVTLRRGRRIKPASWAFHLTGYPVNLKYYTHKVLVCATGHYNLVGPPSTHIRHTGKIRPAAGALALTGRSLNLTKGPVEPRILFDSKAQSAWIRDTLNGPGTETFSFYHTQGLGHNRVLLVGVVCFAIDKTPLPTCSDVSYNGVPLSKVISEATTDFYGHNTAEVSLWILPAPDVGYHLVSVTINGAVDNASAVSVSYLGAKQTTGVIYEKGWFWSDLDGDGELKLNLIPTLDKSWIYAVGALFSNSTQPYTYFNPDPALTDRGSSQDNNPWWRFWDLLAGDIDNLPALVPVDVGGSIGYFNAAVLAAVVLEPAYLDEYILPQPKGVYFDATASFPWIATPTGTGVYTFSYNHIVGPGLRGMLIVGVTVTGTSNNLSPPTPECQVEFVTFYNINMVKVSDVITWNGSSFINTTIWMLHSPPLGSHPIVVTYYLFGSPSCNISSASASYIGVFHLEQPDAQGSGHETATLTTRSVGCWIFAMGCIVNNAASTLDPKQTGRATVSSTNNTLKMIAEDTNGPVMNDVANTMGVTPGPYTQCLTAAIAFGTGGSIAILPGEFHLEGKNVMMKYSAWGDYDHPKQAPYVADGLYIIRRRALGAGVKKTLLCQPYNDKAFDFRIAPASGERSNFGAWGAGSWGDYTAWPHYHFLRNDPDMMLTAFWSSGQDIFSMYPDGSPLIPPSELITKLTVKAYVKGRCRTVLGVASDYRMKDITFYRNALTRDKGTFVWVETDYLRNPKTGAAWDWGTIFNDVCAGIDLRSPISTLTAWETWEQAQSPDIYPWDYNDWPIKGTEQAPLPNGCPIPYDARIERIEEAGKCVYLKITVAYDGLWGGQHFAGEIDFWPVADIMAEFCCDDTLGAAPRLLPSLGNVLRGGKILNYLPPTDNSNMHFWSRGNANPGFIGSGVWNLPTTLSFTGIKVSVPILLVGYQHGTISCNLYIKFDGVTYQLAGPQGLGASAIATATWNSNPKTGGVWKTPDLKKITEVGVIFTGMGLASDAMLGVCMPYAELRQSPPATRGGSYKRVEVGDDSQIYLIGMDNFLYKWDLSNQFTMLNTSQQMSRLAVICKYADASVDCYPEKTLFGLTTAGTLKWGYNPIWWEPWGGGTFLDLAACRGGPNPGNPSFTLNIVYLVQTDYTILRDDEYTSVPYAAGANTEKIAVTNDGHLFCIDRTSHNLKEWNGSTWLNHGGLCLELTANSVTEVYVIGTDHNIYLWNGTAFSQFTTSGDVLDLAIHPLGHLFYLTTGNVLKDWTYTAFGYRNGPVVLPVNKWTPSFGKSYAGCTADDLLGYYVGPDINTNHPRFTSNQFHGSLMDHGNLISRYESDLSEIPPENSVPISIEVYLSFNGFAEDQVNSKIRMYVYTNGRRYYSNVILFNNYLYLINDFTYTWSLNPATGAAWTYDDFQGLGFGVEVTRVNADYNVYFNLYRLDAEIQYYEGQGYTCSLAPVEPLRILEFTRYAQNPIKADDLVFSLPANSILEELTPLALYRGGKPVWQGLVWTRDELLNSVEVIHRAKAQQIMLYFKYLPSFSTYPRNSYYDTVYSLADLFSDVAPEYPAYQHLAESLCPGAYYNCYWEDITQAEKDLNADLIAHGKSPVWSPDVSPGATALADLGIQTVQAHDSKIGLFFLLNGIIPVSRASNILKGFASQIRGKPKFLLSHVSMMGPHNDLSEAWTYSFDIHTSPSWPLPMAGVGGAWSHAVYIPSQISGFSNVRGIKVYPDNNYLRRLKPGDPVANFDEYSVSGEDVTLHPWAAGSIVAVYHALDTWLRPGVFDSGNKYLSVPWLFGMRSFAESFNALFPAISKEIEFLPSSDCLVYMNVKDRVGSGSETEPVRYYVHGQEDTWITQEHILFPHYDIAIGDCITPQAAANWPTHGPVIEKVVTSYANDLSILRKFLAASLDDDPLSYVINKLGEDWDLCQGDTISVQPRRGSALICRVSKVSTLPGRTVIYAGKRIITLEEMFQGWSNIEGGGQLDHVLQSDDISIDGPTGTKTFIVKAENVDETWRCKIDFSWSLWTDSNYTTPVTPPANLFVTIALNGKVIPPGRIRQLNNDGSISIDLTDYVSTSTTSNTTNTLVFKLWNGIAKQANFYHKISGTVTQISTAELLETQ